MDDFEMTQEQLDGLMNASKPVMAIMLQCGMPRSPQENANAAWQLLGQAMGFDHTTVRPVRGKGNRFFTATELTGEGEEL